MMNVLIRALAALSIGLCVAAASAQTANGTSTTSCTQTGSTLTCTSSTTVSLPSGVNLQTGTNLTQFGLTGGATGPACTGMSANPPSVPAGGTSPVLLSVSCPAGSYNYVWASPVAPVNNYYTSVSPNLSGATPSITYSVTVCLAANSAACNTYSTAVTLIGSTPALAGCSISATATNVTTGATPTLSATCAQGTGGNSGVTYSWTRNGSTIGGANSANYQLTSADTAVAGSVTYAVAINNNLPSTATPSPQIVVTATAPTGGATDYCPTTSVRTTLAASSPYSRFKTSDYGSFTSGNDFIIQLNVTSADTTNGRQVVLLNYSDIGANAGARFVTISKSKCDFTSTAKWVSPYSQGQAYATNAGAQTLSLNDAGGPGPLRLDTGTWYINVRNAPGNCPSNLSCHVVLDWAN